MAKNKITFIYLTFLLLCATNSKAQNSPYVSKIIEYHPAPGQFINTSAWGTPEKANSLKGGINGGISLGGYGGYIILGFDHTIENDPTNPYGIDFTVFGNPLATNGEITWTEPGIVMVMKDENGNGLADDTWYELAGSDHYFSTSVKNYEVTYTNPQEAVATKVPWSDNQNNSGYVLANSFHQQPYYPLAENFPTIIQNEITFFGTKISGHIDWSDPSSIRSYKRGFGYTDNSLAVTGDPTIPDNPYTSVTEGAGGDAFDINWAIDAAGNHVALEGIDFIKIYTAINADAGWLGEVSTEVRGVVDVAPNPSLSGILEQVVMADIPKKIDVGTEILLEAYAFNKGRLNKEASVEYTISDPSIAEIIDGKLIPKASGEVQVIASLANNPNIKDFQNSQVIAPEFIGIELALQSLRVNTKKELAAKITDRNGKEINGIALIWSTSDKQLLTIIQEDDQSFMQAKEEGSAWLKVSAINMPDLKDSVLINILPESDQKHIYLTIKNDEELLMDRTQVAVKNFDLNPYVDNAQENYSIEKVEGITAAHAIAQLFPNEDFFSDLRFRDDERGDGALYLWRVPITNNSNVSYDYGYGGSAEPSFEKAWLVKVNQHTYVNKLHEIPLNEEDEIIVYQVNKVSETWIFKHLTSDNDSINIDEPVVIRAQQSEHSLNDDRSVNTLSSAVLENAEITVNEALYQVGNIPVLTDELGQATLRFSTGGVKKIQVDGEFLSVFVKTEQITSIDQEKQNRISVFPNPFNQTINIKGVAKGTELNYEIMSLEGKIQKKAYLHTSDNTISIDTYGLISGSYILRIISGNTISHFKILKL